MEKNEEINNLLKLGERYKKIPINDRKSFRKLVLAKINREEARKGANDFFDRLEAAL